MLKTLFLFGLAIGFLAESRPALADDMDLSPAQLARCKAATVFVDLGKEGSGSGFFVHACGLFVTNRHVVEAAANPAEIKIVLNSGQADQKAVKARTVALSEDADLALLKTDEPLSIEPLPLANGDGLTELSKVIVFGYPFGKMLAEGDTPFPTMSLNVGRISALRRDAGSLERIQLDAAANPGNSGGPVVNKDGKVLGIIASGIPGALVSFAIPSGKLLDLLKQPLLSLRATEIPYTQRASSREFEAEIIPTTPVPADAEMSLKFGDAGEAQRSFPMIRKNGSYSVKAAPCQPFAPGLPRLLIEAQFGTMMTYFSVDDAPIHLGGRTVRLSEVRAIDKQKGAFTTTLVYADKEREQYETVQGRIRDLPNLQSKYNDITLNLEEAQHIKVGAYDAGDVKIPYELALTSKGAIVATSHGTLSLTDPPRSLGSGDEMKVSRRHMFFVISSFEESAGFKLNPVIDLEKDVRQGTWTRNNGALETKAEPNAWCNIPLLPKKDYHFEATIIPRQKGRGELLFELPIGKTRTLLHIDGEKGFMKLDIAEPSDADGETKTAIAPFEKNKQFELNVDVSISGENAAIHAACGNDMREIFWAGRMKRLGPPKDVPPTLGAMAIGHRSLEMSVEKMKINGEDGGLQVQREMPFSYLRTSEWFLGRWPLNTRPEGKKIPSTGGGFAMVQIGTPEIGAAPGLLGAGAMKLDGSGSGLQLEENDYTNKTWHPQRTFLFWFKADAPDAKDQRQYLLDEGGTEKGFAIYLEDGVLFAGGWDGSQHWKSWLKAPGIVAGKWFHVTLILGCQGEGPAQIPGTLSQRRRSGARVGQRDRHARTDRLRHDCENDAGLRG